MIFIIATGKVSRTPKEGIRKEPTPELLSGLHTLHDTRAPIPTHTIHMYDKHITVPAYPEPWQVAEGTPAKGVGGKRAPGTDLLSTKG